MAQKRIMKEYTDFIKDPIPGITIWMNPEDCFTWIASIEGGKNTPYEGGNWQLEVKLPKDYPFKPPKIKFLTKIYHQGITPIGDLCCCYTNNLIHYQWSPALTIPKVLQEYLYNLDENHMYIIEDCGGGREMHEQFRTDRNKFMEIAKEWTKKYALKADAGFGSDEVQCSICTEIISAKDSETKLGCGHRYHSKCLQKWSQKTCPYCKQEY